MRSIWTINKTCKKTKKKVTVRRTIHDTTVDILLRRRIFPKALNTERFQAGCYSYHYEAVGRELANSLQSIAQKWCFLSRVFEPGPCIQSSARSLLVDTEMILQKIVNLYFNGLLLIVLRTRWGRQVASFLLFFFYEHEKTGVFCRD